MKMKELDTKDAGAYAVFAMLDAQRRNTNNKSHYTEAEIRQARTSLDLLDNAYVYKQSFINYRHKFVVIKLVGARVKNRPLLNEIEEIFSARDAIKTVTAQGINYRFNKK